MAQKQAEDDKIRLDKWLWAARFYKTRALAKAAIESGKVHCRGERCKPGKEPRVLLLCEFEDCWAGTMHLDLTKECRIKSIDIIEKIVKELSAKKAVFLMGDWNANPASTELGMIRKFMQVVSCENTATVHGTKLSEAERVNANHCIDFIAVDAAHAARYKASDARVVEDRKTSDHAPIRVTVERIKSCE